MSLKWRHSATFLTKDGVCTIPHPSMITTWDDNMSKWPKITTTKIFSYFVDSMAVDGNAINNLKSSEAYQYLHSNKVGCVLLHERDPFIYMKADVEPSQCLNDLVHKPWVVVANNTGDVETAGCTCVAGPGRSCSHAAAVLWKVENAVRQGKTGLACTDVPNSWNAGSRCNSGQQKMKDVSFQRHKENTLYKSALQPSSTSNAPGTSRKVVLHDTLEEWQAYCLSTPIAALFTAPGNGLLQLTFKTDLSAQLATKVPAPLVPNHGEHSPEFVCVKCRAFYNKYIDMDTAQLVLIEQQTKAQSREQVWHDMRRIRITASTAKKVPVRGTTSPQKFLSEHLHPTFHGNAATRHGSDSEEHARQHLQEEGYAIEVKGLMASPSEPWLAASPDGIIGTDTLLEIKCPVIAKDQSFTETLKAKSSDMKPLPNGDFILSLNGPKGYYMQVKLGMHCTGLQLALLVVWAKNKYVRIDVPYNHTYVEGHIKRLRSFYYTHMLPKIVDEFDEGRLELCSRYLAVVNSP